jgi:serine/threonine protein kinase
LQPPEDLGIPGPYRSPELILHKVAGFGSDLWALGCTPFEIRTGRKLFSPFDDEDDDYLDAIIQVLGKLPEPWWSTTWEARRRLYEDEADEQGRAVATMKLKTNTDHSGEEEMDIY